MKKLLPFVLLILFGSPLFFSCHKSIPDPVVLVDSTTLKPEIKISYEILDSGYVQFHLLSPDNGIYGWYTIFGTIYYSTNPKIWFRNGLNEIGFGTRSKYNVFADTSIYINITNSVPQIDSKRFVKGVIFGDSIDVTYDVDIQNTFKGWPLLPYDSLTPVAAVWPGDPYIILADLNTTRGTDINKIRNLLKVGQVAMANYSTGMLDNGNIYLKNRTTDGWNLFISHKSKKRNEIAFTSTGRNESLEILDVREIYQPPIFPGLESTAFIATFHYKGLLWGQPTQTSAEVYEKISGRDKIDLIFDVKFNIYPKWVK